MTRALRHRNFRLFYFGQMISLVGTFMQQVATSWLVYRLTGSGAMLGWLVFATQLPLLFLSPATGAFADGHDRRKILIGTQALSLLWALALAILTWSDNIAVWHVFALSIALGITNAFDQPTRQSFVVQMVGREDLQNAIALNSTLFQASRIVGPALAGILIGVVGEAWCFFLNAISFLAVIFGLWRIRVLQQEAPRKHSSLRDSMLEGFRYVRSRPPIRFLLLMVAFASIFGMSLIGMGPMIADQLLHLGSRGLGALLSAMGAGALIAALRLTMIQDTRTLPRWMAGSMLGMGVFLPLFALSPYFWLSLVLIAPIGFCVVTQMASANTLLQTHVNDNLRGRVMAFHGMIALGFMPIGAWITGHAADAFGLRPVLIVNGLICLVFAFYAIRKSQDT